MADRLGQQLGHYRLVRLLGRGGFAEVYLGEHLRLGTQAAVKVLYTRLASTDDRESFEKEARTVAHLKHPYIVRVLDYDVEEDTPFLVMDYAPGGTLRQRHPRGDILPLTTIIAYVKQIADALQYAHDQHIIHRDVKPENMLIGEHDELMLSDFGIAIVAQSSRYQSIQDMAGTIAYMAPEQIQAHPRPASDQYSLAVVVYEWLSGDRPFHGSYSEIAVKHTVVPPPLLHEKVPTISADVEQVVMTALAKDPKQRFGSVRAFANALEQANQVNIPTFVKPPPPAVKAPHIVKTDPPVEVKLPPQEEATTNSLHQSTVTPPLISELPTLLAPTLMGTTLYFYRGHSAYVNAVTWSPDGIYIASGSSDKTVQVWDASRGGIITTYHGHAGDVNAVAWSPDGTCIASGSYDRTVQVWDVGDGGYMHTYRGHSYAVRTVAWSPDGTCIASGSFDRTVQVWDAVNGGHVYTYRGHASVVDTVAWSPDSRRIASGSSDGTVQVWDAVNGGHVYTYRGHSTNVWTVAWSPNGQRIASASGDGTVQMWDAANGGNVYTYHGHSGPVTTVAWSPDGQRIASASGDGTVQMWQAV